MSLSKFAARRRGFTLIELLIVIVVIAILALIVIPKLMGASRKAKDSTLKANLQILRNAIATYEADMGSYPTNTDLSQLYTAPTGSLATTWKGPYLKAEGAIIGATAIPMNPYASSSTVTDHWTYTAADGSVKPNAAAPGGNDADGKAYSSY